MMKKAIVVDFDGTLVKVNSFELFFKFLFREAILHQKLGDLAVLTFQIIKRKLRLQTHAEMKRNLLCHWDKSLSVDTVDTFVELLRRHVNKKVEGMLWSYKRQGMYILLSSAAPSIYLEAFAKKYLPACDDILCTRQPKGRHDSTWKENLGINKLHATMDFLRARNMMVSILITDHYDDLPLLMIDKDENILVNPSEKTRDILAREGIAFVSLDC